MPRTAESAADRQKRLDRERRGPVGVVDMGPVTLETNARPRGAREVSREEFERIQRGERPVVDGLDIEIGDAVFETDDPDIARFNARPSGGRMPSTLADRVTTVAAGEIPPEWMRGSGPGETQEQANTRDAGRQADAARERDRGRRRREAYARNPIDGLVMDSDNLEAARAGVVQGLTLGFGDELAGAARHPWDTQPQPRGFGRPERATYESERDRARAENETAERASPNWYAGGEVLGSALPALAMPAPRAATAMGRVAQAGEMGGMFGGASGLGHARGTAAEQYGETVRGAGYGMAGGAAGQMAGEGLAAGHRWLDAAPEGTPRPGGDFTPEQRARIDADPDLAGMSAERDAAEFSASVRRVQTAHPNITRGELENIERTYEGGLRGFARDMDAGGISPRRSMSGTPDVQRRAAVAGRPVVDIEPPQPAMPPSPMPDDVMPAGTRAGQFPDDEGVRMAPPSGETAQPRDWRQDIPDDPHDAAPFDPNDTLEQQMRREFAREGRSTGASTQAGTNPRVRAGRPDRPIEFAEGMRAGDRVGRMRPESLIDEGDAVIASRAPIEPQRPAVDLGDEPIDFAMDPEPRSGALDDAHAARRQANIRAAERRARRGGYSESTQDERTWPVRPGDVEDITPAAPSAQPPPLPRRAPVVPQQNAPDLGRWEAPPAAPATPPAHPQTPGQRAAPVVREMGRSAELERMTRGTPQDQRGAVRRVVEDQIVSRFLQGRGAGAMASANEAQSDMLAREIVRRLADNPAGRTASEQLRRTLNERGPRAFGLALQVLHRRQPELDSDITSVLAPEEPAYVPPRLRQRSQGAQQTQPAGEQSEWDSPYRPGARQ